MSDLEDILGNLTDDEMAALLELMRDGGQKLLAAREPETPEQTAERLQAEEEALRVVPDDNDWLSGATVVFNDKTASLKKEK